MSDKDIIIIIFIFLFIYFYYLLFLLFLLFIIIIIFIYYYYYCPTHNTLEANGYQSARCCPWSAKNKLEPVTKQSK